MLNKCINLLVYEEKMSNYLAFPGPDSRAWFFLPAASIAGAAIASRVTAGLLGAGAKALSNVTNRLGIENLGKNVDAVGTKLIAYATRSPKSEITSIFSWTLLGGAAYGVTEFSSNPNGGVYSLLPKSLQTLPWEKITTHISENSSFGGLFFAGVQLLSDIAIRPVNNLEQELENKIEIIEEADLEIETESEVGSESEVESTSNEETIEESLTTVLNLSQGFYTGVLKQDENGNNIPFGLGTFIDFTNNKRYDGTFDNNVFLEGTISDYINQTEKNQDEETIQQPWISSVKKKSIFDA